MKSTLSFICFLLNIFLASNSFQTSLFKTLNKEYINKNLLISPLSVFQVLGLTANGAKGETLNQMLSVLENSNIADVNTINKLILLAINNFQSVEIANAIMTIKEPKSTFLQVGRLYQATVDTLRSAAQVNNWCNLKTHGKITEIIEEIEPNTVMMLLNALYFEGQWQTEFDTKNTTKRDFYHLGGTKRATKVDSMALYERFNYYDDREVQIVEMPYKDDSMSAVVILPNNGININDYIESLDDFKLQKYFKRMNNEIVELHLPKFSFECSSLFNTALQKMGMTVPFGGEADFSGILDEFIYISKVIQKSFLSVDEHGTVATSVTSEAINVRGEGPRVFDVNRPFLFLIRNTLLPTNNEMLFMSKVEDLS
jgi:serpin B